MDQSLVYAIVVVSRCDLCCQRDLSIQLLSQDPNRVRDELAKLRARGEVELYTTATPLGKPDADPLDPRHCVNLDSTPATAAKSATTPEQAIHLATTPATLEPVGAPSREFKLVLVGPPGAGKSTWLRYVAGRASAAESEMPAIVPVALPTTRGIIRFSIYDDPLDYKDADGCIAMAAEGIWWMHATDGVNRVRDLVEAPIPTVLVKSKSPIAGALGAARVHTPSHLYDKYPIAVISTFGCRGLRAPLKFIARALLRDPYLDLE